MWVNSSSTVFETQVLFYMFFPTVVIVPIIGFPTNIYVLWHLLRKPGLCSTSDIFVANLAALDALTCLFQPVEVTSAIISQPQDMVLCSILLNLFAGPLFQMCLCVDCYLGVLHPIVFLKFKAPQFRLLLCLAVWAMTSTMYLVAHFKGHYTFGLELIVGFLTAELGIMALCNVLVLRALKRQGPGSRQIHPAKLRAHKIILALLIMVMVHYLIPLLNFLMISYNLVGRFSIFSILAFMLMSMSTCNHPLFYLIKAGKISNSCC